MGSVQLEATLVYVLPVAAYPDQFVLVVEAFLAPLSDVSGCTACRMAPPGWSVAPLAVCGAPATAVVADGPDVAA